MAGCRTKYPILLAHGLGVTEQGGLYAPWGRIPDTLRAQGAAVYFGGQDAWGSIETGAGQMKRAVDRALRETGCDRVNIIAHSKGGLEARYLISAKGYGGRVASLSMLATPNRGSRVAELLLVRPAGRCGMGARQRCILGKARGRKPDSLRAGEQLTPKYLAQFNRDNPDAEGVYYQSWGARLGKMRADAATQLTRGLLYRAWGQRRPRFAIPPAGGLARHAGGVSHQQLVDVFRRDVNGFDVCGFISSWCRAGGLGFEQA